MIAIFCDTILVQNQRKLILNQESFWSSLDPPRWHILVNPDPSPPNNLVPANFSPKWSYKLIKKAGHLNAANIRSWSSPAPKGFEATSLKATQPRKWTMFAGRDSPLPWEPSLGIQKKRHTTSDIVPGTRSHADIIEHRIILIQNLHGKSLQEYTINC